MTEQPDPGDVSHSDGDLKEKFNTTKYNLLLNIIWLRGCQEGNGKQDISGFRKLHFTFSDFQKNVTH